MVGDTMEEVTQFLKQQSDKEAASVSISKKQGLG